MKLSIKIDELDYGDIFIKLARFSAAAPGDYSGPFGAKVSQMAQLPSYQIRDALSQLSDAEKAGLLSGFTTECKDTLIQIINNELNHQRIQVTLTDFAIDQELNIIAHLGQLDYPSLVSRFLPAVRRRLLKMGGPAALLRPLIEKASAEQICGIMDRLAGSNKDAFLVTLINQNQSKFISFIEKTAKKEYLRVTVESLRAEA